MKTTNFILTAFALVMLIGFTSCDEGKCIKGIGDRVTRQLDLQDFHSITSSGDFDITFEQADEQRVEVTSYQNIIDDLELDVVNGTWDIELEKNRCYKNTDIEIRIWVPEIRSLESDGSIDIVINSFEGLQNLDIDCSGSGRIFQTGVLDIQNRFSMNSTGSTDLTAHVNAQLVDIDITGSGNVKLQGTTVHEKFDISGSGDIDAFNLEADTTDIDISGSGDIEVTVNDQLDVRISGSGNVRYMGNPSINSNVTGSGSLIDAN